MEKKSNPISMIVMMAVIGIIISFFGTDFEIGPILEGLEIDNLKVLLDYINFGLGFLVLAGIFIVLMVRAAKDDKEYFWDFNTDDFREEE